MFGRAAIMLGIGPHSSCLFFFCLFVNSIIQKVMSRFASNLVEVDNGPNKS